MKLTSSTFKDGGTILARFSRDGANINPPLAWTGAPEAAKSFAIIMEDPDVPRAAGVSVWDHWIVFNIPPTITKIPEGWRVVGTKGAGTRGELEYGGPRPPDREHRYVFTVYALDDMLTAPEGVKKGELLAAMNGHILDRATLIGRFAPPRR
jgi:Raf kinase inhibitor-like YbhB/YbcL family protein